MSLDIYKYHTDPAKLKFGDAAGQKKFEVYNWFQSFIAYFHISNIEVRAPWKHYYKENKPLIEKVIAQNPRHSFLYAAHVIQGRFPLGEKIIATNARHSFAYADEVLHGRFEMGEKAIATDDKYSYMYARRVLKGRFELGEQIILANNEKNEYGWRYYEDVLEPNGLKVKGFDYDGS